jgi:hypothetical protein
MLRASRSGDGHPPHGTGAVPAARAGDSVRAVEAPQLQHPRLRPSPPCTSTASARPAPAAAGSPGPIPAAGRQTEIDPHIHLYYCMHA